MLDVREERMSEAMVKYHLGVIDAPAVIHRFSAPDHGEPHDHAMWPFRSTILWGGYVEERYQLDGSFDRVHRRPGDSFEVSPDDIHRIVDLPDGECVTIITPGPPTGRKPGFYQWRDGVMWSRRWDEGEFTPHG